MMIAVVQLSIYFYVLPQYLKGNSLSTPAFFYALISTMLIAIGGNIINDIRDKEIDLINKPNKVWVDKFIASNRAKIIYIILNVIALVFAYFSVKDLDIKLLSWFVFPMFLLYIYAVSLKKVMIIANLLVSILVSYSMLLIVILSIYNQPEIKDSLFSFPSFLMFVLGFSAILNWIREIVKDVEDMIGDKVGGVRSLPIVIGVVTTKKIIFWFTVALVLFAMFWVLKYIRSQTLFGVYLLLSVVLGLWLFLRQLKVASRMQDFSKLSELLKLLMLIGLFSIFLIKF
jgi:4-hydroxybenzoate polyprenyltransferase